MEPIHLCLSGFIRVVLIAEQELVTEGKLMPAIAYSIYLDNDQSVQSLLEAEVKRHLDDINDPDYLGQIFIENRDNIFYYKSVHEQCFDAREVEELAEMILAYWGKRWLNLMKAICKAIEPGKDINDRNAA